jgi:hypothetical protein
LGKCLKEYAEVWKKPDSLRSKAVINKLGSLLDNDQENELVGLLKTYLNGIIDLGDDPKEQGKNLKKELKDHLGRAEKEISSNNSKKNVLKMKILSVVYGHLGKYGVIPK